LSRILLLLNLLFILCNYIWQHLSFIYFTENNVTLARDQYIITPEVFDQKIRELVLQYNYTLNPQGIYEAIKYMYTYWPDPLNVTHIRDQYINVSSM